MTPNAARMTNFRAHTDGSRSLCPGSPTRQQLQHPSLFTCQQITYFKDRLSLRTLRRSFSSVTLVSSAMDLKISLPIRSKPIKIENVRTSLTVRESSALRKIEEKIRLMSLGAGPDRNANPKKNDEANGYSSKLVNPCQPAEQQESFPALGAEKQGRVPYSASADGTMIKPIHESGDHVHANILNLGFAQNPSATTIVTKHSGSGDVSSSFQLPFPKEPHGSLVQAELVYTDLTIAIPSTVLDSSSTTADGKENTTPARKVPEHLKDIYDVLRGRLGIDVASQPDRQPVTAAHWREIAFCQSHPTPPGLLDLPEWKDLRPTNFRIVRQPTPYMTLKTALFYIKPKPGVNFGPEFFEIRVVDPSGTSIPVEVKRDMTCLGCLECVFRPMDPGSHKVVVQLGHRDSHHINESPMHIDVCRNYLFHGNGNVVVIEPENAPRPICQNGYWYPPWCQILGITTNGSKDTVYAITRGGHVLKFVFTDHGFMLNSVFGLSRITNTGKEMFRPTAVAYDTKSNLLVATDPTQHCVCKFSLAGEFVMSFGAPGTEIGEFLDPCGVAVSTDGNTIAVTDSSNRRIQLFDSFGASIALRVMPERPESPVTNNVRILGGLMFNSQGDEIYFTDTLSQAVHVLNLHLITVMVLDLKPFDFNATPSGIALDNTGNIILCDKSTNVIRIFNQDGVLIHTIFMTGNRTIQGPEQVLILRNGYCLILDKGGKRFRIF